MSHSSILHFFYREPTGGRSFVSFSILTKKLRWEFKFYFFKHLTVDLNLQLRPQTFKLQVYRVQVENTVHPSTLTSTAKVHSPPSYSTPRVQERSTVSPDGQGESAERFRDKNKVWEPVKNWKLCVTLKYGSFLPTTIPSRLFSWKEGQGPLMV